MRAASVRLALRLRPPVFSSAVDIDFTLPFDGGGPAPRRFATHEGRPAAIQRADREFCRRIRSAARIAARFRREFLLPMFRSAQFTALRTKFLSSRASRSITRKKRSNLASEACLSL